MIQCDVCAICLCEIDFSDSHTLIPCNHSFHKKCVFATYENKCALCRCTPINLFNSDHLHSLRKYISNDVGICICWNLCNELNPDFKLSLEDFIIILNTRFDLNK